MMVVGCKRLIEFDYASISKLCQTIFVYLIKTYQKYMKHLTNHIAKCKFLVMVLSLWLIATTTTKKKDKEN